MGKKLRLLCLAAILAASFLLTSPGSSQSTRVALTNRCIECHSKISSPPDLSGRYFDWYFSAHGKAGVGCEKCHGGDSTMRNPHRAHQGVSAPSQAASRLGEANLPDTCGACHGVTVDSFVKSTHYARLKSSGLGPSCRTCHGHMGTALTTHPSETATYCTFCHNSINGLLPPRPDIPQKAQRIMESIARANFAVLRIGELLNEAETRKVDAAAEKNDLRLLRALLSEAKVGWHSFDLDAVQTKADKAFAEAIRIRDLLAQKLDGREGR